MIERTLHFPNLDELSRSAVRLIEEAADDAVRQRGSFSLVLSGGSTPRRLFELFGTEWRDRIPWTQTHLFWADERFVPIDDPENNYRVARQLFIDRVPIPPDNVHPIDTDVPSHTVAAEAYETLLRSHFAESPTFDLALLGMGADGHTASLFPGDPLESSRWVEAVTGPAYRPPANRITLTLRALNASRRAVFLISGRDKVEIVERIREGHGGALPASRIRPAEELVWMLAP